MLKRTLAALALTLAAVSPPLTASAAPHSACLVSKSVTFKVRATTTELQRRRIVRRVADCGRVVRVVIVKGPWKTTATFTPGNWGS